MKYLFVLAAYSDNRQQIFDEIISPCNKQYCEKHGFKYVEIRKENNVVPFRGNLTWNKWSIIQSLIKSDTLKDGDIIIQQDADVAIADMNASYEPVEGKSMSICIDSGNTFCHGIFGLRVNDWTRQLVDNILDEDRFQRMSREYTIHEGIPNRPPTTFISEFREQAVFYDLFGIKRHSWIPFTELPNKGVHSDKKNTTFYSVEDFDSNVQVLPVEYNLTIWPGESDTSFYINKFDNRDGVKFRHFTGSDWRVASKWIN